MTSGSGRRALETSKMTPNSEVQRTFCLDPLGVDDRRLILLMRPSLVHDAERAAMIEA